MKRKILFYLFSFFAITLFSPKSLLAASFNAAQCSASGGAYASGASECSTIDPTFSSIGDFLNSSGVVNGVCCAGPSTSTTATASMPYTLLEKIPFSDSRAGDLPGYLQTLYKFTFWAIGIAALFMLSIGGFMYVTSAGNTSRMGTAKEIIFDSIIGIVIALFAWLFLYIINPDFVSMKLPAVSSTTSTAVTPTPGTTPAPGSGSGCGGYASQVGQCGDTAQPLSDILACMFKLYPNTQITSISDSQGFATCKNSWSRPPCAHAETSCHYGGGKSQTDSACQKSLAADLSIKDATGTVNLTKAFAIKEAAAKCGARVYDESSGPQPHIHISAPTSCCSL